MDLVTIIQQIDQKKNELDALRPISPEREAKIKQTFRLWWNYHSNAIEGNQLTLGETISLILHDLTAKGKSYKDHREVKGHNEALLWVEDVVDENRPLTQNFIRELHQMILKESYDSPAITPTGQTVPKKIKIGQYKTTPNHVRTSTGEIYHYALPEEVPSMISDLLQWYDKEKIETHPLILAATFHYRFVKIHPFDDGNGRMSRILMNLILMRGNYPPAIIKMEKRNEYLAALGEADAGDLEKFILFVGESLLESVDLYVRGAKGENIGEEDDLDKKIALLKLQLKNQGKKEKQLIEKTITIQKQLFINFIKPLLLNTEKRLLSFNDFFHENSHNFYIAYDKIVNGKERKFTQRYSIISEVEKIFYHEDVTSIKLFFKWEGFKFSNKLFNLNKDLQIDFYTKNYNIKSSSIININNTYEIYKQQKINQVITTITESILEEIQQKTNTKLD